MVRAGETGDVCGTSSAPTKSRLFTIALLARALVADSAVRGGHGGLHEAIDERFARELEFRRLQHS